MSPMLSWLAPPLLGGLIGYLTNYVAIRMLFRPLRPWRIFGLRLPMTPGVIPAKRHQLAENIGEMVGEHLLTRDDLGRAVGDPGFQRDLKALIEGRIESTLALDLGPVAEIIPARFRSYFEVGIKILRWRFLKHLHLHLESDAFAERVGAAIAGQLEAFLGRSLDACLPEESRRRFFAAVAETLTRLLSDPAVEEWLADAIHREVTGFIDRGGTPGELLPEELREALLDRIEAEAPLILTRLAAMVEEPATRQRITLALVNAISRFTASLGPVAAMIGSLVSPETIGARIEEYLAGKGKDLGAWLLDSAVQDQVAHVLRRKAAEFLATPVAELTRELEPDTMRTAAARIGRTAAGFLKRPEMAGTIGRLLEEAFASQGDRPLAGILSDLGGPGWVDQGRNRITAELVGVVRSQKVKRMLDELVTELVEKKLLARPVGPLADFLPQEVQEGLGDYLVQQVNALLAREVPGLVDCLNIRGLVSRKVDSLDLLRLEQLLLSIMEEQFKYINLFGALLGFLIGLVNLLFLLPA